MPTESDTDIDTDDSDNPSIDDVKSDADIYGTVTKSDRGATITTDPVETELPDLHDDHRVADPGTDTSPWLSHDTRWIIAAESRSGGVHNYFTVAQSMGSAEVERAGSRFRFNGGNAHEVRFGHMVRDPAVDELLVASSSELRDLGINQPVEFEHGTRGRIDSNIDIVSELHDRVLEHDHTTHGGEWVHGFTRVNNGPAYEIFVPHDDLRINTDRGGRLWIGFTDSSITIAESDRTPVTGRQDGLYVNTVHTVSEDDVPDVDTYENDRDITARSYSEY